jgi:hypothetical protein
VSSYRVGWLAKEDYLAYIDNDIWRQKFAYSDVIASSTYTVVRLTPGADYYLTWAENTMATSRGPGGRN